MICPFCSHYDTHVLESRSVDEGKKLRRRRKCAKCKKRFTTYEAVEGMALLVIKKDGRREQFDKYKVKKGILRATEKRPVEMSKVDEIVEAVEREMMRKLSGEVSTDTIGKAVMKRLKRVDKVAWLRFASVYLEFEDLKDFEKAIK